MIAVRHKEFCAVRVTDRRAREEAGRKKRGGIRAPTDADPAKAERPSLPPLAPPPGALAGVENVRPVTPIDVRRGGLSCNSAAPTVLRSDNARLPRAAGGARVRTHVGPEY
ncbi:hypothetical protein GCM10009838_05430 [Catenulispora subtropica]|uniref:Uncharacterized protein n=1 Tax=Catenulispora subtropica TaxID=450798 RepID=A0ABP5BV32_9ACTN